MLFLIGSCRRVCSTRYCLSWPDACIGGYFAWMSLCIASVTKRCPNYHEVSIFKHKKTAPSPPLVEVWMEPSRTTSVGWWGGYMPLCPFALYHSILVNRAVK